MYTEKVFVVGASGHIGSGVVRGLIQNGIDTTAYVRNEQKAKDLFADELKTGHLMITVGDYTTIDAYTKAIPGHTRLFLLVGDNGGKPTSMRDIKESFGRIAYEQGVRQIVDLSSASVGSHGKTGIIGYMQTIAEEKLWLLADTHPEQRSLVVLRPGAFMTNHLFIDVHSIKYANKIVSSGQPSTTLTWTDSKDIADCAVVVLSESVEKHDRNVYEMGGENLSHEQRAAVFSKVLGKPIKYEQLTVEEFYKTITSSGLPHSAAYDLTSIYAKNGAELPTPQLSILIHRPLRTFEEWLTDNIKAFQ